MKCSKCNKALDEYSAYEYRGAFACEEHFEDVVEARDTQRRDIINEEDNKTKVFKGLDLTDSAIGKENRKLLSRHIEIASKESAKLRDYERPEEK